MTTLTTPTTEEIAALQTFRRKYGARGWKVALLHKWNSNRTHLESGTEHLNRLAKDLGPNWLRSFVLPPEDTCTRS